MEELPVAMLVEVTRDGQLRWIRDARFASLRRRVAHVKENGRSLGGRMLLNVIYD